jgi:hypothetical protein
LRATQGKYLENGLRSAQLRRSDVAPNTSMRDVRNNFGKRGLPRQN